MNRIYLIIFICLCIGNIPLFYGMDAGNTLGEMNFLKAFVLAFAAAIWEMGALHFLKNLVLSAVS